MFIPSMNDIDKLPSINTPYPNVFISGDYLNTSDTTFTVEASCISANQCALKIYKLLLHH
jgi:uncharacterized protein with NAD-binding domain and iron-sulfur cluster